MLLAPRFLLFERIELNMLPVPLNPLPNQLFFDGSDLRKRLASSQPTVATITPTAKKSIRTIEIMSLKMGKKPGEYASPQASAEMMRKDESRIIKEGSSLAHLFFVCLW